jgi:DNA excision repair protein ERCC-4
MKVIIDTREKKPYDYIFDMVGVKYKFKKLNVGDYSIEGKEDVISIERKSLSDFVSSISKGRKRFEAELERARSYKFFAIIIEGSYFDIKIQRYESKMDRKAVLATINKWRVKYNRPIILANSREEAALATLQMLEAARDYDI